MAYRAIPLAQLLLDSQNPRLRSVQGQPEIITALLGDQPKKVLNLAKDIVASGGLSPIDIPYVVPHRKTFLVVEGNRRVAALKILDNPDLVQGTSVFKDFKTLAMAMNLGSEVFCAIASNRQEARHWIELRHTGEREGVGVIPWTAVMRERFSPTPGSQSHKALALADELASVYTSDQEFMSVIDEVRDNQLTLLGRLVADPTVRYRLGITIQGGDVSANYTSSDLRPALFRILGDIAARTVTSRSLNGKEDRAQYLHDIAADLPVETKRTLHAVPLKALGPKPEDTPKPKPKPKPKPPNPRLFPQLGLDNFPPRVSEILGEINKLNVEQFPNSVAVLLRVLVELVVYEFASSKHWAQPKDLKSGVRSCADHIDTTHKSDDLRAVRTSMTDGNHFLAVKTIQQFLHNSRFHPVPADLRAIAANYQYFLQQLNNRIP